MTTSVREIHQTNGIEVGLRVFLVQSKHADLTTDADNVRRYKKANVTHPELGVTVQLPIVSTMQIPRQRIVARMVSFLTLNRSRSRRIPATHCRPTLL